MGMAALLCESAGWWPLATLYSNLSQVGGWAGMRTAAPDTLPAKYTAQLEAPCVSFRMPAFGAPHLTAPFLPCPCPPVPCQMAAAGVRQDLLPLMRIPDMDAAKARALFKAGLRDAQVRLAAACDAGLCRLQVLLTSEPHNGLLILMPVSRHAVIRAVLQAGCQSVHASGLSLQMLATADEQAVARALAPAIAQQMRSRSSGGKQQQQQRGSGAAALAATAGYAAAGMAARAAGTVVQCARDHLRQQMQDLAALAADIQEDEVAAAAAGTSAMQQSGQQHLELPALHAAAAAAGQTGPQQQARQPAAIAAGQDELSPDELAHIRRQVAQVAGPGGALPGSPDERQAAEVSIAPAAKRVWTQGVVRWGPAGVGSCWKAGTTPGFISCLSMMGARDVLLPLRHCADVLTSRRDCCCCCRCLCAG